MGYYDEVKENVRSEASDSAKSSGSSGPSFDKLKEAAQDTDPEEEEGDDTEIEVVGEDRIESRSQTKSVSNEGSRKESLSDDNEITKETVDIESSELSEKLDKLIEQNDRIIEILESFGS